MIVGPVNNNSRKDVTFVYMLPINALNVVVSIHYKSFMRNLLVPILSIVVSMSAMAQQALRTPEDLKNWLPSEIPGYVADKDAYAAEQNQLGNTYFIAAKKFTKDQAVVSIVAFDYRKKSEQIEKSVALWALDKKMEDDKVYSINSMVAGCKAQETFDKIKNTAQLYLYHEDRYLITLTSTAENLEFLKTVAANLPLTSLPK
jgi:hypothetical protein